MVIKKKKKKVKKKKEIEMESQIISYVIEKKGQKGSIAYAELRLKKPFKKLREKYSDIQKKNIYERNVEIKVVYRLRKEKRKKYIELRKKGYGTIKRIKYTHEKYKKMKKDLLEDRNLLRFPEEINKLSRMELIQYLMKLLKKTDLKSYYYWRDFENHIGKTKGVNRSMNIGFETEEEHYISVYVNYGGVWVYDEIFYL